MVKSQCLSIFVELDASIPHETHGCHDAHLEHKWPRNRQRGRIFSGYSLVGHSLGGLVARVIAVHVDLTPRNLAPKWYGQLIWVPSGNLT